MSLGEWRIANPADVVIDADPDERPEEWCVYAESEVQLDVTRRALRRSYFFPPVPPSPPMLPEPATESTPVNACGLGFVILEWTEADSAAAFLEHRATSAQLAAALDGRWQNTWLHDDVQVATGIATPGAGTAHAERYRVTVALAGMHDVELRSDVRIRRPVNDRFDGWHGEWSRRLAEVSRLAVDEPALLADVDTAASSAGSPSGHGLGDSTLEDLITGLVTRAAALPPGRRAAALLTADLLLSRLGRQSWGEADVTEPRTRFTSLGADFEYGPLGNYHVYERTWAWQALDLDPHGRAGELALLELMERGFTRSATCRDPGATGFREVIRRGEEHLRDWPDSAIRSDVLFLVAHAYSDIVALAAIGSEVDVDWRVLASSYTGEAPFARQRALEYFRKAFDAAPHSPRVDTAWATAWRLAAGLPPTWTRFFCEYD